MMLHVDLCCGLGGWQQPFREDDSWRSIGIDIRGDLEVDVIADVRQLPIRASPTLLTASPPCQPYSTAWNRWVPLPERDPDTSIWEACEAAVDTLDPEWWVIENVAGAQHFHGPSDRNVGPYHLWGEWPIMDVHDPWAKKKGDSTAADGGGMESAKIPYRLADALKRGVELYT